jgi:hypothetical protein
MIFSVVPFKRKKKKILDLSLPPCIRIGLGQIVRPFIHSILQKVAAASFIYPGHQLTHPSPTTYNTIISENAEKITQPRLINHYGIG